MRVFENETKAGRSSDPGTQHADCTSLVRESKLYLMTWEEETFAQYLTFGFCL